MATCGDCEYCGERHECPDCAGGYRNECNSPKWKEYQERTGDDTHINAELGACELDFKPKAQQSIVN